MVRHVALWLCAASIVGCAAGNKGSTDVPVGDGNPMDGDGPADGDGNADGNDGNDGNPGDDGNDGNDGNDDGDGPVGPTCTYADPDANCAYKDPSLPDGVKDSFGGSSSATGAPALVYPYAESMHAPNLGKIFFHWSQGASTNTVFRIELESGGNKLRIYAPCTTAECIYQMPRNEWLTAGKEFAGKAVKVTIAGTDGSGGAVALSSESTIHFAPEGVFGALYYWAAQADQIKRADISAETATPFIEPNSPTNEYDCVGCHSVSRDGTVIAFAVSPSVPAPGEGSILSAIQTAPISDPASPYIKPANGPTAFSATPFTMADGSTWTPGTEVKGPTNQLGHNVALSPDGKVAAINGIPTTSGGWPPFFELRDARSGTTLGKWNLGDPMFGTSTGEGLLPIFPEWSPDGKSIVATLAEERGEGCFYTAETCRGAIVVIPVNGSTLGAPKVIVNASENEFHFYPTWSPDGKWIAFASGKRGDGASSQSNDNAMLRLVSATGGAVTCPGSDCIELSRGAGYTPAEAAAGDGKHSTWPKFTPFAQKNGSLMFISFNSHLDYGFTEPVVGSDGVRLSQIWMFAVDVSKVGSGDPSYAPVWLPMQDPNDGSLTPYWSERLPCSKDPDGGCSGCVGTEECITDISGQCSCVAPPPL